MISFPRATAMPLARQRRPRPSPSGGLTRAAGVLAGLAGLAAIAAVVWFNLAYPPVEVDKQTLCPKAGPVSTTVVLIDVSDPLPPVAQEDVKNEITDAVKNVPKFGLLELRLLDPKINGGQLLFSRCNPGDGRNLSEIIANPAMERRKFEEGFATPLQNLLGSAIQSDPAQSSPLMEAIQWIAVKTFAAPGRTNEKSRLILVSDMIQHSDKYSLYKGDAAFDRFRRSPSYEVLRTDLNEAETTVFFIHRESFATSDSDLIAFWEQWFRDNNGSLVRVKKIQGTQ
jgi:hypothetical protein